jgi:hypothetical protein
MSDFKKALTALAELRKMNINFKKPPTGPGGYIMRGMKYSKTLNKALHHSHVKHTKESPKILLKKIENKLRNNAAKIIQTKFRNRQHKRKIAAKTIQRTVKAHLYKPITGAMYKKILASTRVGR